jgi:replicative DNA helicase
MNAPAHSFDLELPNAIECEQSLLGSVLNNPDTLDKVRGFLSADDFYEDLHKRIYAIMCERRDAGEAITLRFIRVALGEADLGGRTVGEYLAMLVSNAIGFDALDHAKIVRRARQMRVAVSAGQDLLSAMSTRSPAEDPSADFQAAISTLDAIVTENADGHMRRVSLAKAGVEALSHVQNIQQGKIKPGLTYGLSSIDRLTFGMQPGQLVILAGRPGMGKSSVGLHMALHAAKSSGVAFFSLEMGAREISQRALSAVSYARGKPIPYQAIVEAKSLTNADMENLIDCQRRIDRLPLYIEPQPAISISQIAARSRQLKAKLAASGGDLRLIVVDHLGLMEVASRYKGNRTNEVSELTGGLKKLARELDLTILCLSQLNRGNEHRPIQDRRPVLHDLRDSGSIEQDADVVMSVFREEYYLEREPDKTDEELARLDACRNQMEIEILKQRQGATARVTCFCDISCNYFAELAR